MRFSELWQHDLGAAEAPVGNVALHRRSLEMTLVRAYDKTLSRMRRDELLRLQGALAAACRLDVVPVWPADGVVNLRHFVNLGTGIVQLRWIEPEDLEVTGGRTTEGVTIADCQLLGRKRQRCQLVFAGPDDQAYLVVRSHRRRQQLAQGPPINLLYRARSAGNDPIAKAMKKVNRADFMRPETRDLALLDRAIPIADGPTTSQPSLIAFMLRLLDIQPGDAVEEIGSGGGFLLAVASQLAGPAGKVVGCEVVSELLEAARDNVAPYKQAPITLVQAWPGYKIGAAELGPFDRIIVSAGADCIPVELIEQLAPGGRMVIPVSSTLAVVNKTVAGEVQYRFLTEPGVGFVPLV